MAMTDKSRSSRMSKVRSQNTALENTVRSALHNNGFRFRIHKKDLPGTPDVVLKRFNTAVFVNGCFWHGHTCRRANLPKTNTEFWAKKITRNVERDAQNKSELENRGWKVRVVWGCQLDDDLNALIEELGEARDIHQSE